MGIPYSRQINAAFLQVTPLVAAGFKVLQTTKNISILLAAIQVLTVLLLGLILVVLFGVLVSLDPELEEERGRWVRPAVRGVLGAVEGVGRGLWGLVVLGLLGGVVGGGWGVWVGGRSGRLENEEGDEVDEGLELSDEARTGAELTGEDIEAIKAGKAKQ